MNEERKLVTYTRQGYIGAITLNVPEKRNALNPKVWKALDEAIAEAETDREARVVLLQGEGKSFCAGLDLSPDNELFTMLTGTPNAAQKVFFYREVRRAQDIHTRLDRLARPTLAVIQNHCLGAGLELALCCDLLLCNQGALFALPEARLGFVTDVGGLQRLTRAVGRAHAREIAFRGHRFDSTRALAIGLVNYVLPDETTLEAKARELAEEIAANPPLAVQGAKEVLTFDEENGLRESLEYNAARSSMIVPSEDLNEAFAAFLEKRPGNYKGV
ncbi:MAG: enoyl-CoA hydratase-related protein [Thermodesulfobacteriota bacterium]